MSYYFIAQIKIKDNTNYQRYIDKAPEIFSKYNGTYLAADDNPQILEGNWKYTRSVLIEFKSKKDFNQWYHSVFRFRRAEIPGSGSQSGRTARLDLRLGGGLLHRHQAGRSFLYFI